MFRLLKDGTFCVSFYGWNKADVFISAWRAAGFTLAGHIVFRKSYSSSVRLLRYQHEQAYLLCKGQLPRISSPISDVIDFPYTGNTLHPTQKPTAGFRAAHPRVLPLGRGRPRPILGSASTLVSAQKAGRRYIGIELDRAHYMTACLRLNQSDPHISEMPRYD